MRVAIRVDASQRIGTGHLRRCLALARALADCGAEVRFVTRALGLDSVGMIGAAGFARTALLGPPGPVFAPDPAIPHAAWGEVPQQRDVEETVAALADFAPALTVVDSYALDARWHEAVAAQLGCRIAAIDDLADRALACEVLVDHTFAAGHRAKYAAVLPASARLLGGPRFALLGPAYAAAPRYEFGPEVRSIGVFMGGTDPDGFSARVLDALDLAGFAGEVEVVATSANPGLAGLRERVAARPRTTLAVDLPDLAAFFARHDLQIGAGGGASWERCCIGVPTLLVVIAPNQLAVAPLLAEAGIAEFAPDPAPAALAEKLAGLIADSPRRAALAEASRRLVDGRGAERVALALLAPTLAVREARAEDACLLFGWRNAPANRRRMREQGAIAWPDHVAWLDRVLADAARRLYVGEIGGRPVGAIRFDDLDKDGSEVSLHLDPAFAGLGLGPHLLAAGETAADPDCVTAEVLADNAPSQALFERAGYRRLGPTRFEKRRRPAAGRATA